MSALIDITVIMDIAKYILVAIVKMIEIVALWVLVKNINV